MKLPFNYFNILITKRISFLFICFILMFTSSIGLLNLNFNNDIEVYFSKDNPEYDSYLTIKNNYGFDMNAFILIEPVNHKVFDHSVLTAIQETVDSCWRLPYCARVDALTNYQDIKEKNGDIEVKDLIGDLSNISKTELKLIKEASIKNSNLLNRIINSDASFTGVNISFKLPNNKEFVNNQVKKYSNINQKKYPSPEGEIASKIRSFIKQLEKKHPNLKFYISGSVMLSNAFYEASFEDLTNLFPISCVFTFVILFVLFFASVFNQTNRIKIWNSLSISLFLTISCIVIILFSITTTIGLVSFLGIQLNTLTASAPAMILTLAIADCVHIILAFIEEMKRGVSKNQALLNSLKINLKPVFLTSLTTVIGFLALNFSDSQPFVDLGNIVALGASLEMIFSIILLIPILSILPIRILPNTEFTIKKKDKILMSNFVFKNKRTIVFLGLAISLILGFFASKNVLDERFVDYFDNSTEFRADTEIMTKELSGLYTIEYSLSAGSSGDINNPEYIQMLSEFKNWFLKNKDVRHVSSYSDLIYNMDAAIGFDSIKKGTIHDMRNKNAQNLFLYEMSVPEGLDVSNLVNNDRSETRFVITVNNISSNKLITLNDKGIKKWKEISKNLKVSQIDMGTSAAILFAKLTKHQVNSMLMGGLFVILLVIIILMIFFRSLFVGYVSILPNILPLFIGFGIWYFLDGKISSGLNTVFCITIGIIIDDTIHFFSKFIYAHRELSKSNISSVYYALDSVGSALVVTSITLTMGFLILSFSTFTPNADMAILSSIILVFGLLFDILFLPALLFIIFSKHKKNV